jgi:hypothetical protein
MVYVPRYLRWPADVDLIVELVDRGRRARRTVTPRRVVLTTDRNVTGHIANSPVRVHDGRSARSLLPETPAVHSALDQGILVAPSKIQRIPSRPLGALTRPEFVVVHRDNRAFPGVLYEWRRRREPDGIVKRSARVIYLDGKKVLRQSWFLEAFVEAAPFVGPS